MIYKRLNTSCFGPSLVLVILCCLFEIGSLPIGAQQPEQELGKRNSTATNESTILTHRITPPGGEVKQQEDDHSSTGATLTVKLESVAEKNQHSSPAEILKSISELLGVLAWPVVFVMLLLTQRKGLSQLLGSLVDAVGKSTRLKLGELIDLEVDRSARQAEQNPAPPREVPVQEREAASRVDKLVGDSELPAVRQRMLELAREYEATRSNLKPGSERTRAMNAIVAKMRTLAIAAKRFLEELAMSPASPGNRLAAIAILQLSPSLEYVSWLVGRMEEEQPFVFFHASLALLAAVRSFGARNQAELKPALEQSLLIVKSFKGGQPDRNTVGTLEQALSELSN